MDSRKQTSARGTSVSQQGSKTVGGATAVATITVDDNCILFGRGKGCNNNPANAKMRLVIDRYRDEYQAARRGKKKELVLKVHKELVEEGMKFLKQEKGIDGWIEADANEAITKVGHAIRCIRKSKCKSEEDSDDKPPATAMFMPQAAGLEASVPDQGLQDCLPQVVQEDVASLRAFASALTSSASGFPSIGGLGYQPILGSTLSIGANPLLSLERLPVDLTTLHPPLSTLLPLTQTPQASMALNGLSPIDIYVLIERERQLQKAMLYRHTLRNPNQR